MPRLSGWQKKAVITLFWVLLWQVCSMVVRNRILLVGPLETLQALYARLFQPSFWPAVWFSFGRICLGFLLAFFSGLLTGALSYWKPLIGDFLAPPIQFMKSIPVASFVILALFWTGAENLSVFISFIVVYPMIHVNTLAGLLSTDEKLLEMIKKRISNLKVDALTMNQESLAECIFPHKWFNPFPKFKFSERPDTAAASILEGNIIVLVDNSPSAMILPSSVFDIIEEADDYYFPPITGTYLRISRMAISTLSLIVTPTWLLFMQNPELIPEWLAFIRLSDPYNVPLIWQLLILEFAIDGLRLAAVNTPNMLTTPLSVIAGIVLGEYAVKSGWFNSETMLYMAFVTIANYSQASFELGYAMKFMRILILILTALFNIWGYVLGMVLTVCAIVFNRTIAGKSYIYPLIPFRFSELKKRFLRGRLPHQEKG